ncbi:hypothetical protein FQN60_001123 [Etheostoma spectabile]|uniref:Uncharacterized protein n=1 Tax=Etheostoma spectabile TaxID=54343 RepID=A0A5J5D330_9PERO|nr:hypothetical protein FQN60_001123 [Etheostoma spectabile]
MTNSTAQDSRSRCCCQVLGTNCGLHRHISFTLCRLPSELHHITSQNEANVLAYQRKCEVVLPV